ncbi:MAG: ABC transporter substrate-binding protein [Elainellaceae cyanobacterium]
MSQKNETPVLLLSLLITLALIGGGLWWLGRRLTLEGLPVIGDNPALPGGNGAGANRPASLPDRLSTGDKALVSQSTSPAKQAGIAALADRNYEQAVQSLENYLSQERNDPEALIYLNNARIGDQRSHTIAVSVPLATSTEPALEILRGVAQAQNEVNEAGGVNGVPLKVLIASDDNQVEVVEEVAQALVNDSSVLGVVGHFGSEATLAAADIYEQGGLVMVSPTSTSVQISSEGDYIFRTVPSDRFTATTLADYMLNELGQQNAAVYYNSESDYSASLKNQFTTALSSGGGQVVEEVDVVGSAFDASDSLNRVTQRGAEVIVLTTNTPTLDQAMQIVRANDQQLPILGGDSLYNPKVLEDGQRAAEGMIVAVPWIISANFRSPFVQNSQRLWGGDVNWRTAMAYDAARVLIEGISQNPTRQGIQQALSNPGFGIEGATGQIQFLSSGDRNAPMQLAIIEPGSRSSYGYDFVSLP